MSNQIIAPCHVRWMVRRDVPDVLEAEKLSFDCPWTEEDVLRCLRQHDVFGMVAERDNRVVGFMIYVLEKKHLEVLNFCVHPEYRRSGVGRAMVDKLASKLDVRRRKEITLHVRESNLGAQLFFRAMGFRAQSVERWFYEETGEDAYYFCRREF